MAKWSRKSEGISVGKFWRRVRSFPSDKPHFPARFLSMGFWKKTPVEWSIRARSISPNTSYVHAFRPFWVRCDSSLNFRCFQKRVYGISRPSVFISVKGNGRTSHFPSWYRLSSPQIWSSLTWDQAQFSFRFVITFRRARRNENNWAWPQVRSSYSASWNRARLTVKFCVKAGTLGVREFWGISCIL